jgi:hypothetical protein
MPYLDAALAIWGEYRADEQRFCVTTAKDAKECELLGESAHFAGVADGGWPPRDPRLAEWPASWRERWARRSAELEDAGTRWPDSERRAFLETVAERLAVGLGAEAEPDEQDDEPEPATVVELAPVKDALARPYGVRQSLEQKHAVRLKPLLAGNLHR